MINLGAPAQAVHKFDVVHYFASCPIKSLYYIPFRIKWYNISFTEFLWDCCVNSSLLLNAFLSAYSPSKNWQVTALPSYKLPILSSSSLKSQWREIIDIKRSVQSNHIIWCGLWCSNWILFGRVCGSLKKKKKEESVVFLGLFTSSNLTKPFPFVFTVQVIPFSCFSPPPKSHFSTVFHIVVIVRFIILPVFIRRLNETQNCSWTYSPYKPILFNQFKDSVMGCR